MGSDEKLSVAACPLLMIYFCMVLVNSMREIQAGYLHFRLVHPLQHLHRSGSRTRGTNDASVEGCDGYRVSVQGRMCSRKVSAWLRRAAGSG